MPNPMQPTEIFRAVIITLLAIFLMFVAQPWLYQNTGLKPILITSDLETEWIPDHYFRGAALVAACSLVAQVFWFFIATRYKDSDLKADKMLVPWMGLLILSLFGIGISLMIIETSDAFPSLLFFWLSAVLMIYWLATAMNTPTALKYIIPGSQSLRKIFP